MKLKNQLTGSNYVSNKDEKDSLAYNDMEILDLLEGLATKLFEMDAERVYHELKKPQSGYTKHWFINASTKMIECFPANLKVEIIEEYSEDSYLCFAGGCNIIVKKELILDEVES